MEDNIEVKDVQKTEYLDKNGLDMLWTKIKENTHNQVEVERNRAVAKENSISDKVDNLKYVPYTKLELSRYNIPYGISTGYITSKGDDNDRFDVYPNAELTSGTLYGGVTIHSESDEYHSTKEIKVDYDDMRIKFTDGTPSNVYAIYGEKGVNLKINNSSQSLLTADQSVKVIGTDIAPLENGKVPEEYLDLSQYAKKTDISEFDTSDFVSKNDTITQTINSGLIAKTTQINKNSIEFTDVQNGDYIFRIDTTGIHYNGRKENEIPTANGGFVNINNYALKSELPTVPAKVSQLQNDSEFIVKSVYDEKIAALEARIAALEAKHAEAA